jgi:hypothetical protein
VLDVVLVTSVVLVTTPLVLALVLDILEDVVEVVVIATLVELEDEVPPAHGAEMQNHAKSIVSCTGTVCPTP